MSIEIETTPAGSLIIRDADFKEHSFILDADGLDTLRKYFQAERDQELGRWRDPENPNMVVYPDPSPDWVLVLDEESGDTDTVFRRERQSHEDDDFTLVADRYFDAHPEPEPKPWEDAKFGEVWALTVNGTKQLYRHAQNGLYNLGNGVPLSRSRARPTAGRRIWPEQEAFTAEDVERVARVLCVQAGVDPEESMGLGVSAWVDFYDQACAVLGTVGSVE